MVLFVLACHSNKDGGEIKIIKIEADSALGYVNVVGQAVDEAGKPFYKGGGPYGYRHNKAYIYQSDSDREPLVLDGKWRKTETQTELTYTAEVLIPKDWENVSLVYTLYAIGGGVYIYCSDVLVYSEAPCRPYFLSICMRTPLSNVKPGQVNTIKVRIVKGPEWNGVLVTSLIPSTNIVGDSHLKECKFSLVYPIALEGGRYLLTYFHNEEVQVFKSLGEVKEIFGGKDPVIPKIKTELPEKNFPGLNLPQTIYFNIGYGPAALQFEPTVLLSPLALSLGLNIFPWGGSVIWSPDGEVKLSETDKDLIQRLNDLGVVLFYGSGIHAGVPGLPNEKGLRDKLIRLVPGEEVEILDQKGKTNVLHTIPFSNYNTKAINLRKFVLEKVVELYNKEVKYLVFHTYNEPSYGSGSGEKARIIDYSEPSIREFRRWLKEKHRSLDRLNKTWGSKYKSWEEIEPPRFLFPKEQPQKAAWYDWTIFRTEEFAKFFEREYKVIKSIDLKIPVVTRYPSSIYMSGVGYTRTIGAHDWALLYDKTTDFAQMHFHPEMIFGRGDYCFEIDAVRGLSNKKYLWSEEWYADWAHVERPVPDKIMGQIVTRNLWLAVARNVVGFCNWYGYQFLSPFNKDVANQFKEEVEKIRKVESYLFDSEIEEAPVAILDPFTSSIQIDNGHAFEDSVEGYHHALAYNRLYPIGFISERYLNELDKYKVLYIPYSPYMRKDVYNKIKEWVKEGGTIIADGPIGIYDEYGYFQEGGLLSEVFGASVDLKSDLGWGRGEIQLEKNLGEFSKGTTFVWHFDNESVFKEHALLPQRAEVIATYKGRPIITKGKYGKGVAYLCGLPLGFRSHNRSDRDPREPLKTWGKLIASFALDVGIEPKIKVTNPNLDLIPRKGKDGELYLFITNWDPMRTQEGVIEVAGRYKEVRELIDEEEIPFEPCGRGVKFEVEVLPGKAKVIALSPAVKAGERVIYFNPVESLEDWSRGSMQGEEGTDWTYSQSLDKDSKVGEYSVRCDIKTNGWYNINYRFSEEIALDFSKQSKQVLIYWAKATGMGVPPVEPRLGVKGGVWGFLRWFEGIKLDGKWHEYRLRLKDLAVVGGIKEGDKVKPDPNWVFNGILTWCQGAAGRRADISIYFDGIKIIEETE